MTASDIQKLTQLFDLIAKRANLMKEVAADKRLKRQGVYVAAREIKLLDNTQKIAKSHSLPVYPLMIFAQMQMDLSKYIEQYWLDSWDRQPQSISRKSSSLKDLRLKIEHIDGQLYPAIKLATPLLKKLSLATIMPLFDEAMTNVLGVPSSPNYGHIMLYALIAVATATQ